MARNTTTGGPFVVRVAVVGCPCGRFPLQHAMHRTSRQAWQAAADHVALNPGTCRPVMGWDHVPPALAAGLPAAPAEETRGAFVAVA